ncbi:MAG: acetylglutamate kinase [Thermodesulfovibrionales bacterium]
MERLVEKANVLVEALPYIQSFFGKTFVIKYGGAAQKDEELKRAFAQDIVLLNFIGIRPVIIHGGGPKITDTMERMGKKASFVHGHRVTDHETMEIVEMVLGGLINKQIVSLINSQGGRAVGLSGKDGGLIKGKRKLLREAPGSEGIDIGLVGEVTDVAPSVLQSLEKSGFIPVISPVGVGPDSETLNINADEISSAVAAALKAEKIIFITDVEGIKNKKGEVLPTITQSQAQKLMTAGTIAGGMLPKVMSAVKALQGGVRKAHIIDGRVPHCLLLEIFTRRGIGTEILVK